MRAFESSSRSRTFPNVCFRHFTALWSTTIACADVTGFFMADMMTRDALRAVEGSSVFENRVGAVH